MTREQKLEKALKRLVNLKKYRDGNGKTDQYKREEALAWEEAQSLLSYGQNPPEEDPDRG